MTRLTKEDLLNRLPKVWLPICESCLTSKAVAKTFGKASRASSPLELIHNDICGSMSVKVCHGASYFFTFIDDYPRYRFVYLLSHRYEEPDVFKRVVAEVDTEL